MKPTDTIAILAGSTAGTVIAESREQVIAAVLATLAVYALRAIIRIIENRWPIENDDDDEL